MAHTCEGSISLEGDDQRLALGLVEAPDTDVGDSHLDEQVAVD